MSGHVGPTRANTWWGKRTTTVNVTIVVAVLLFCLWKAFFP